MQVIQSEALQLSPWADEHDPLTTEARGPLPAFAELANGQVTQVRRPNRIPRVAAPRQGVCRRLYCRAKVGYLTWQLNSMRARMDQLEAAMNEATQLAISMSKRHQHSPALQARRRVMRADHTALAQEWLRVRQELDNLQVMS